MTKDNNLLGKFELSVIPPSQRGVPQIEVIFGIYTSTLKLQSNVCITILPCLVLLLPTGCVDSGNSKSINITNKQGLFSQDSIDRIIREAEEFRSEDEAQHKLMEALDGLQNLVTELRLERTKYNSGEGPLTTRRRPSLRPSKIRLAGSGGTAGPRRMRTSGKT